MAGNLESFLQSFSKTNEKNTNKIEEKSDFLPKEKKNLNLKIKKPEELINENKEHLDIIDKLFKESGTNIEMKDVWINTYNKALKSIKNNQTVAKIRSGRFRIKPNSAIEILPDLRVESMPITEIFNKKWLEGDK